MLEGERKEHTFADIHCSRERMRTVQVWGAVCHLISASQLPHCFVQTDIFPPVLTQEKDLILCALQKWRALGLQSLLEKLCQESLERQVKQQAPLGNATCPDLHIKAVLC